MAISVDVRERAVAAYEAGAGTIQRVSELFGIGTASLKRWRRRKLEDDTVEPLPHGGGVAPLIDERGENLLKQWLEEQPDVGLQELCDRYNRRRRTTVSVSTIGRCVRNRLGMRRKKSLQAGAARVSSGAKNEAGVLQRDRGAGW